ncbi:MAG: hypothetical protein ACI87N_001856 [Flavobacteriales bacterium]|jgi:hypothetical protein
MVLCFSDVLALDYISKTIVQIGVLQLERSFGAGRINYWHQRITQKMASSLPGKTQHFQTPFVCSWFVNS